MADTVKQMLDTSYDGKIRVFVYGTLKSGRGNNRWFLSDSTLHGRARLDGDWRMIDLGGFPAVLECKKDGAVRTPVCGEVWLVSKDTLRELDRLEGYPEFYKRRPVVTAFGPAWMYFMGEDAVSAPVVPDGLWRPTEEEAACPLYKQSIEA
jgi:gamma-glutamylcyclotransferase (GGCT)/AIG2-like uncharacterized protein YtfP